jgi:transcriptional regulator with XRE-family HTH domain
LASNSSYNRSVISKSAARAVTKPDVNFDLLLRRWRAVRRVNQLHLALDADISTRHLSCVETGRARPSREMVLSLAEALQVPLRERNALLLAAGYAQRSAVGKFWEECALSYKPSESPESHG